MAHASPKRIRNVALVGHRGSGKTSVNEALLFEAGAINRLGSVADGTTVSDSAADEKAREMSISASLVLVPLGRPQDQPDRHPGRAQLRGRRAARAARLRGRGVRGQRRDGRRGDHRRASGSAPPSSGLARLLFVNMLDRERADFFRTLDSLKEAFGPARRGHRDPDRRRARARGRDRPDRHEGLPLRRRRARTTARRSRSPRSSPTAGPGVPREADGRGGRGLRRADGALPRGRGDLPRGDRQRAQDGRHRGTRSSRSPAAPPRATSAPTGCSTRSSRTCPRRPRAGAIEVDGVTLEPDESKDMVAFVFKTLADPFAGRLNLFRVYQGVLEHDSPGPQLPRARQGADRPAAGAAGQGDRARRRVRPRRHRRGGEAQGDPRGRRARRQGHASCRSSLPAMPRPVMAFAIEAKAKGDEDKVFTALRRLQEEDPTIDFHRDEQTGEQIVAGLTQIHVEVIVDRMKERFGAEVELQAAARALPRDDQGQRQGARPLQEADRRPRPVRRLPHRDRAARPGRRASSS